MKYPILSAAVVMTALLFSAHPSWATEVNTDKSGNLEPTRKESASHEAARKSKLAEKQHAAAKIKLVNINAATKAELMKLPGIGSAQADKIIAGRPYGSKAWLVTNKVITEGEFMNIRKLIAAGDGPGTADLLKKKK